MGTLAKLLGAPVSNLVDSVGSIIDRVVTTDKDRLEAQRALVEIERDFHTRVMELDQEWARTQAEVIGKEIQSKSWMARNWRPILMLTFTYIIAHNFILAPVFGAPIAEIPTDMWDLLKIGMGGYIVGRTVEKTAPSVTEVLKKK